jgi:RNA polymerase sigma-70 factor (ECF subfamily)
MKTARSPQQSDQDSPAGYDPVRLIEQHQAGVWRYLRALGCDPTDADDLTQDVFVAVLQRPFHDYNQVATAAYLRRTAYNMFVTVQRRLGRQRTVNNFDQMDAEWTRWVVDDSGEALIEALRECLEGLTERARNALRMRFANGESRANIADSLGLKPNGAKNLMQRAKQQLRRCIEGKLE